MSICRFTVRWFCVILLLLITPFFDKIAILTKLSAKIWFKLLESAYNNILP